jgi:hypothetical protein
MEKKFLGKALIGKQVAQDLTDNKGVLLMRSGTVLTEAKVALLQKYHIVQVFVKG